MESPRLSLILKVPLNKTPNYQFRLSGNEMLCKVCIYTVSLQQWVLAGFLWICVLPWGYIWPSKVSSIHDPLWISKSNNKKEKWKKKENLFPQILFQNLDILLFTITVIFNHSPQEIIQLPYSCFWNEYNFPYCVNSVRKNEIKQLFQSLCSPGHVRTDKHDHLRIRSILFPMEPETRVPWWKVSCHL